MADQQFSSSLKFLLPPRFYFKEEEQEEKERELERYLLSLQDALQDIAHRLASWEKMARQEEDVTFTNNYTTNTYVTNAVYFDTAGNNYWIYNSDTGYLECWVQGAKRMEL